MSVRQIVLTIVRFCDLKRSPGRHVHRALKIKKSMRNTSTKMKATTESVKLKDKIEQTTAIKYVLSDYSLMQITTARYADRMTKI